MLQITCLSSTTFMVLGNRNDYIICKSYTGDYKVIPVKNNPNVDPLLTVKSLDECIKFLDMADNAETID